MATKYQTYTPGTYKESEELKKAKEQAAYWNNQQTQNFTYEDFKDSQQTTDFLNQYNNLQGPGQFQFSKQQGWDNIINQIMNREKFSYDVNGDALYQQYKDQYVNQGKMAMMDTMGQAAAMTGGYGNSYAQSVGQQAYQGYLQQLTDKVPELYQLALDKYNSEGQDLYNKYGLYSDQYGVEYGQHRDAVGDYQADRSHLGDMWSKSHAVDMDTYTANRDTAMAENESYNSNVINNRNSFNEIYNNLKNSEWGRYMDNETLKKVAIEVANDKLHNEEQDRIASIAASNAGSGGGNGGGNGGSGGAYSNVLWYDTGTTDDNGNKIFRNSDGKTQSFGKGVNPYTGTTNADAKKGTFSNGYQPDNIGGVKLKKAKDETGSVIYTSVTGKEQAIWQAGGRYYIWRGDLNRYVEAELPK